MTTNASAPDRLAGNVYEALSSLQAFDETGAVEAAGGPLTHRFFAAWSRRTNEAQTQSRGGCCVLPLCGPSLSQ